MCKCCAACVDVVVFWYCDTVRIYQIWIVFPENDMLGSLGRSQTQAFQCLCCQTPPHPELVWIRISVVERAKGSGQDLFLVKARRVNTTHTVADLNHRCHYVIARKQSLPDPSQTKQDCSHTRQGLGLMSFSCLPYYCSSKYLRMQGAASRAREIRYAKDSDRVRPDLAQEG